MLKISRLSLHNIRCFPQLEINFEGDTRGILLVGDNGDGKSTVLRSLAIGLCDQSSAAALFRELQGNFVRKGAGSNKGSVVIDFNAADGWYYRIKTKFKTLKSFERIEQDYYRSKGKGHFKKIEHDDFPWGKLFASGYGPGIRSYGNEDYSNYRAVDAVYSLFRYDASLQNPELVIRRLIDEAGKDNVSSKRRAFLKLRDTLAYLLNLNSPNAITLNRRGIFLDGNWGTEELGSLGDGFRATTTWLLDLISWWLLYSDDRAASNFKSADIDGIVIIDELEQHLHPRWQRRILPQLFESFPKIQFVVSTHSPLVASSSQDVSIHNLNQKNPTVDVSVPYGWCAEDVYQMMGVESSRAASFEKVIDEFARLDAEKIRKTLTPINAKRLQNLKKEFKRLPSEDPVRLMIELQNIAQTVKTNTL